MPLRRCVTLTVARPPVDRAPLLLLPRWEDAPHPLAGDAPDEVAGCATANAATFQAKPWEVCELRACAALLIGLGPRRAWTPNAARRLGAAIAGCARRRAAARCDLWIAADVSEGLLAEESLAALCDGLGLASFDNGKYKSRDAAHCQPTYRIVVSEPASHLDILSRIVERALTVADAVDATRDLVNEPPNILTPRTMAERGADVLRDLPITVEVWDAARIESEGLEFVTAVAQGSREPARVLVIDYCPATVALPEVLGLIGKGVTFDSGGISIKPADGMDRMKCDMAGGAAVITAMAALAALGAPRRLLAVVPIVENMPGGAALRPGDVVRSVGGKSVEIVNTDSEGRLILADAIAVARARGATHLVDVATLTAGVMAALGKRVTGVFGVPDAWRDHVLGMSSTSGERMWPLPLVPEYRQQFGSEVADLSNGGGRWGSAIAAALFLREFTGDTPWVHLDIAGTAWSDESGPDAMKGATGVAVRTLIALARSAFPPCATAAAASQAEGERREAEPFVGLLTSE